MHIFAGEHAQLLHTWTFKIFSTQSGCWFQVTESGGGCCAEQLNVFFWSLVGWFHRHVEALRKWSWTIRKFWEISWRNLYKACDISILYAFKLMLFNLKSTWFLGCLTAFFLGRNFGGGGELVVIPATLWLCRNTKETILSAKTLQDALSIENYGWRKSCSSKSKAELTGGVKVCKTGVNRNP